MGLLDAWEAMERKASAITRAKNRAQQEVDLKIEAIKQHNRDNPITQPTESIVQIDRQHQPEAESTTIIYNSADYVLSYLFPPNRKKKKK